MCVHTARSGPDRVQAKHISKIRTWAPPSGHADDPGGGSQGGGPVRPLCARREGGQGAVGGGSVPLCSGALRGHLPRRRTAATRGAQEPQRCDSQTCSSTGAETQSHGRTQPCHSPRSTAHSVHTPANHMTCQVPAQLSPPPQLRGKIQGALPGDRAPQHTSASTQPCPCLHPRYRTSKGRPWRAERPCS